MSWLEKLLPPRIQRSDASTRRSVPEGLWVKCPSCEAVLYRTDLESNIHVCPKCGYHFRIGSRERIENLLEPGFQLVDLDLRSTDPLDFTDLKPYKKRLVEAQKKTDLLDA